MMRAGIVNITPVAIAVPADAPVATLIAETGVRVVLREILMEGRQDGDI